MNIIVYNKKSGSSDLTELQHVQDIFPDFKLIDLFSARLKETLAEAKQVLIYGGDGTINFIAELIYKHELDPIIGLLPGGSANGLANEFEVDSLEKAIRTIQTGNSTKIDGLIINDDRVSLHLADFGLNASMINKFEKDDIRGWKGYAYQLLRLIKNYRSKKIRVITPEKDFTTKVFMILIANCTRYGTGIRINRTGDPSDGLFEIIPFHPFPLKKSPQIVYNWLFKSHRENPYIDVTQTKEATFVNLEGLHFQIDGETMGVPKEINVKLLPQRFCIFVP